MKFIVFILAIVFFCSTSAILFDDGEITLHYEYVCDNYETEKWNITGIVNGRDILFASPKSKSPSTVVKESFKVNKTDDLNYKICFSTKSSARLNTYLAVFDEDNNMLIRKHALYHNNICALFTIRRPIDTVSSLAFKRGNVPDNWYKKTFDSSSWETVQNGQQISTSNENQYYRISFEETQFDLMAAYNLHLQLNGDITIYMNDIQVYKTLSINPNNTEELNNMQIILNAYALQKDNILAICISNPAGISQTNYMSIYMTLFFATEEGKCANTLTPHTTDCSNNKDCSNLYDTNISTQWLSTLTKPINAATLLNNTYIDINQYIMAAGTLYDRTPKTYYLKGRNSNNDAWNTIEYCADITVEYQKTIANIYGNTKPYNQIQFQPIMSADQTQIGLGELFLFTCSRAPQPFGYKKQTYTIYLGSASTTIAPLYNGYTGITIEPQLPRGLSINTDTGVISGNPLEVSPDTQYTITAQYPYPISTILHLSVSPCTLAHIKIVRYYANDMTIASEIFTITQVETQEILMDEKLDTVQKRNTTLYYEFCVPYGQYSIKLNNEGSTNYRWQSDSSLSIYLANNYNYNQQNLTDLNGFSLVFKEKRERLGSTNFIVNFEYAVSPQSEWKHNEGSIPSDWFSSTFDDSQWPTITVGKDTLSKAIHIYRKKFSLTSFESYDMGELMVEYYSGIKLYINNKKIFINHIEEPITTSSTANGHYDELIYRRFTIPFHYLQSGDNVIAVMIIPHNDEPSTNYFDLSLRNVGTGDNRAFMSGTSYPDQMKAFDRDYTTKYSFQPTKNNTIYYFNQQDEYATVTMYTINCDYNSYMDVRPHDWILQGRINNHGNEPWIDIDTQTYVNWDVKGQRRIFGVPREKQGLYNEYRLTGITGFYYNLEIYQIEFYSNSLAFNYPSFEYSPNDVSVYIGSYIEEMIPIYDYFYSNYKISPPLPAGMTLNPKTGAIRGIPECVPASIGYTITATTYNNKEVPITVTISYKECIGDQSLLELEMRFNNNYRFIDITIAKGLQGSGDKVLSEDTIEDIYREFRYRDESLDLIRHYYLCIPHSIYKVQLSPHKVEAMTLPYGYSIRNAAKTVLNSGSFDEGHPKSEFIIDTTMPIQSGVSSWSYLASEENIGDWTSKYYDISSWKKMKENNAECNQKRNIYFRTIFEILDITSHSSLDFRIKTIGSLYVYMNEDLVYHMTLNNSTLIEHTFTLNIQNNAIKSKNNILAIHIETKDILETEYLYVDCAYTYGAQTRLMNTFTYSSSSSFSPSHPLSNMFDIDFFTTTEFTGDSQIVNIDMGNEYKRYFNSIFLQTWNSSHPKTMDIYGREEEDYNWIPLLEKFEIPEKGLYSEYISVPMGLAGFRYIQIHFNKGMEKPASTIIAEFNFVYKSYTGSMCPSTDSFISVGEDDTGYGLCGENYQGYTYSICDGLRFDPPNRSFCTLLPPKSVRYPEISYIFFTDTIITPLLPTYERIVDSFNIQPDLPSGLFLESETGKLYGKPTTILSTTTYTLQARNKIGTATFKFTIQINPGYCSMQSYPPTNIHENLILACPDGYYGQIKIPCIAGDTQPVYSIAINECTSLTLTIGISLSVTLAIILIIIVIICIRMNKKNKEEIRRLKNPSEVMRTSNKNKASVTQI